MEEPDVSVMSAGEKPRKYSSGMPYTPDPDEIEKVTVKPSTELIPDEYEHEDNKKGLVLIFYSKRDIENMKLLKQALSDQGYDVPYSNIFELSTKEIVLGILREVATSNHEDKTCFILIFMGNSEHGTEDRFLADDEQDRTNCIFIREVWSLFTSDSCPSLRYKPKIFIFQASKKLEAIEIDGTRQKREQLPSGAYDIPAEADILLVYKKVEDPLGRNNFIEQLCNNIHDDGHKDDMIGVVTHTDHKGEKRPLIISTLTRKFFVRSSNQRGHHHDLYENHDAVIGILQDLNEKINKIQEQQNAFKRKLEQRVVRKWQEPSLAPSSTAVKNEDSTTGSRESPKMEPSSSKKVSRATSSASSVDANPKSKKPAKKPWKY